MYFFPNPMDASLAHLLKSMRVYSRFYWPVIFEPTIPTLFYRGGGEKNLKIIGQKHNFP